MVSEFMTGSKEAKMVDRIVFLSSRRGNNKVYAGELQEGGDGDKFGVRIFL